MVAQFATLNTYGTLQMFYFLKDFSSDEIRSIAAFGQSMESTLQRQLCEKMKNKKSSKMFSIKLNFIFSHCFAIHEFCRRNLNLLAIKERFAKHSNHIYNFGKSF
jgi:hypothetical protein